MRYLIHGASLTNVTDVMTECGTVSPGATGGAGEGAEHRDLSNRVIWGLLAVGMALSLVSLQFTTDNARSFLFDILAVVAAVGAVVGLWCNQPRRRRLWECFTVGLVMFAAGDVVFDLVQRLVGRPDGSPYADVFYFAAYGIVMPPLFARLARCRYSATARPRSTASWSPSRWPRWCGNG